MVDVAGDPARCRSGGRHPAAGVLDQLLVDAELAVLPTRTDILRP
jgi:hypothetical protein